MEPLAVPWCSSASKRRHMQARLTMLVSKQLCALARQPRQAGHAWHLGTSLPGSASCPIGTSVCLRISASGFVLELLSEGRRCF